jgi:CelD/BcsL family acetyltransferase involved in cellulose biosynthesis
VQDDPRRFARDAVLQAAWRSRLDSAWTRTYVTRYTAGAPSKEAALDAISSLQAVEAAQLTGAVQSGGAEIIDGLAPEWRELCEQGPCDQPFYQPEWIAAYVRAYAPRGEVLLVTARAAGRLVGVLPLVRTVGSYSGLRVRKLMSAGNAHTCRYDLIHGNRVDPAPAVWRALRTIPGWDVLELNDVPRTGAAARLARHAQREGHRIANARAETQAYLTLDATHGLAGVLDRVDGKFRANLRRRMRKLEAKGPVRLVRTTQVDERLERFYELEQAGWKGAEQTAIACNPATREFYDEIATVGARRGWFCLYTLECAGQAAAMFYGVRYRARYFPLKTAFDSSLRECSPGQLLTQEVLRDLAADGGEEFDFLGVLMDWKREWAPRLHAHANWYVFNGAWAHLIYSAHFRGRRALSRAFRRIARSQRHD